jgi:hypothetical protein
MLGCLHHREKGGKVHDSSGIRVPEFNPAFNGKGHGSMGTDLDVG